MEATTNLDESTGSSPNLVLILVHEFQSRKSEFRKAKANERSNYGTDENVRFIISASHGNSHDVNHWRQVNVCSFEAFLVGSRLSKYINHHRKQIRESRE